jgi:colicin import membrane protein/protein TonB
VTTQALSALGRPARIWPALLVSALVHGGLAAWALVRRAGPELDYGQKPLVAKLVRLGEVKPPQLLPRKEAEGPPPAPAPSAPAPVVAPHTPPTKSALTAPKAKSAPAAPVNGTAGGDSLARVMSRLERDKAAEAPRWGDPSGDPTGDASEAAEGDRYLALAVRALQENYRVPSTISERDRLHLRATVVLLVEPNGTIRDFRFEKRSGNDSFDAALERAIRATRLPPPPTPMKDAYRRVGLGVNFHI